MELMFDLLAQLFEDQWKVLLNKAVCHPFAKAFSFSVMASSWQLFLQWLEGRNVVRLLFQGILKACIIIIVFQY